MTYLSNKDFGLQCALGLVAGYATESKFGRAEDCDASTPTDIWDGADGATATDIWVPPTQARTHDIVSTSALDAIGSSGMEKVQVVGLTGWDTPEEMEIVELAGLTSVPTAKQYVIIHRMKLAQGKVNVGVVTARAQVDSTITAAIAANVGQTLMAIYGVPSVQRFAMTQIGTALLRSTSAVFADGALLVKENADRPSSDFVYKGAEAFGDGVAIDKTIDPPVVYEGPCIIKLQVEVDTNNTRCTGQFRGYLVDR